MPEGNKPISFLSEKLFAVAEVLREAGRLENATIEALAKALEISPSTLKAQKDRNAISLTAQDRLCELAGFLKADPAWCDTSQDKVVAIDAFRNLLREKLLKSDQFRVHLANSTIAERTVGHHELEDSGQGATQDTSLQFFLEASFGPFRHNGVKYGFTRARLEVDVICHYNAKTQARFAIDEAVPAGKATLSGGGTWRKPAWQIEALAETAMLDGRVNTSENPLMELVGFQQGTIVESRLLVDPHDGILSQETDGASPLSGNQQAIIEMLSAMALDSAKRSDGKIELSLNRHEIRRERFSGGDGND